MGQASKTAPQVKAACCKVWRPEFDLSDPHGGKRGPSPSTCLLIPTCVHGTFAPFLLTYNCVNKCNLKCLNSGLICFVG